jgi:uncharacterized membrane protein
LSGTDTYWHTTLIDEAIERAKNGDPIGPLAESINGGFPYMYDTGRSYPQFSYWVGVAVGLVAGGAAQSFAVMMFGAMLLAQLSFSLWAGPEIARSTR